MNMTIMEFTYKGKTEIKKVGGDWEVMRGFAYEILFI